MNVSKAGLAGIAGAAIVLLSTPAWADPGHHVPSGVSATNHLHMFGDLIVAPGRLVAVGVVVLVVVVMVVRRLRAGPGKNE